ncbi:S8 family serine peptidase, partial [Klebsiella pneumoniae]|uniref:S8 family serine peptidase n=1 Tax=Klebsiella pneumoniae TaxID=573 RepID=UPI003852CE9B
AHIDDAHKYTKGAGIKVAVLDTGYSPHDDIGSNVVQVMNRAGTQTADDHQGHGTHVCGIIAALENDMGIIGVAPQAQLYPIKVLGDGGQGGFDTIEAGIRDAIELKVDIISMSLG